MASLKVKKALYILIIVISIFAGDQISKSIVRKNVEYHKQTEIVGKYLVLTKVENTGAFLGMGDSIPRPLYKLLMIIMPLLVVGYAIYYLIKKNDVSKLLFISLSFIIGGGLGNIYDRILYGSVTDFLYFDFVLFHTGIVNLADIFVTFGFFIILYETYIHNRLSGKKQSNEAK